MVLLLVKGRVYNVTVLSGLLYGCGTWPLRQDDDDDDDDEVI